MTTTRRTYRGGSDSLRGGNSHIARAPRLSKYKRHVWRSIGAMALNAAQVSSAMLMPPASRADGYLMACTPASRAASATAWHFP